MDSTRGPLAGEEALAAAVIGRAVTDITNGSVDTRNAAIRDIAAGGLDYWIDILSVRWDIYDGVHSKLQRVIATATKL